MLDLVRRVALLSAPSLTLVAAPSLSAQDLGGGAPASHGRVPRFVLESWIPGTASAVRLDDAPATLNTAVAVLSTATTALSIPGISGTLIADPSVAVAFGFSPAGTSIGTIPATATGTLFGQSVWIDGASGAGCTDAFQIDLFNPVVMVGNQRQSANSISVIDLVSRTVVDRLGNSENGSIAFSPDRTRAYVCEPGSQRNVVTVYDLTVSPIAQLTQLPTTGGIRYLGVFSPDGGRFFVPVHDGVDIFDTDPTSPTFHLHIGKVPALMLGNPGTIFPGPLDLAITPDGGRLLIAYGVAVPFPAQTPIGVVDLTNPAFPQRQVMLTTGGTVLGLSTKSAVRISPDGAFAYVLEFGFPPGLPLVNGFASGALLSVIDLATETEVAVIPTLGVSQQEMAIDRLGRNLWIAQPDFNGSPELLRIDVDRRSATRNTLRSRIPLMPTGYSISSGARGVDVTPDGSLVCVSMVEDAANPQPLLITVDAKTEQIVGAGIVVESMPGTVSVQQR